MKYIFTIRDSVSEKAGNIFTTDTIGEAERQFHDALKNAQEGSLFRSHPQDFSLHILGLFDEQEMEIVETNTQKICDGKLPQETATRYDEVIKSHFGSESRVSA